MGPLRRDVVPTALPCRQDYKADTEAAEQERLMAEGELALIRMSWNSIRAP